MYAASILRAQVYGIKPILDVDLVMKIAQTVQPPPFKPRAGVKIAVTDAEAKENAEAEDGRFLVSLYSCISHSYFFLSNKLGLLANADTILEQLKVKLARLNTKTLHRLNPIDFEKVCLYSRDFSLPCILSYCFSGLSASCVVLLILD